jgi:hypothetical protein
VQGLRARLAVVAMSPTLDQRLLCPLRSGSSDHYRADGSCRCRNLESSSAPWLIGKARDWLDGRPLSHQADRMLWDAVEILDAYREVLVKIAGDRYPGAPGVTGVLEAQLDALYALEKTMADGPVPIPPGEREDQADRTIGDRRARLKRGGRSTG